ncbi:MAG TPA: CPBP family intramembrane glutamic endopeptidase [Ohtaekwangia sp.]|nr:CPBP family intramembrane glutamic endopeptidase [Ohtaekwangia sp.]
MTIKRFYQQNPGYNAKESLFGLFLIFTIPAMIFSPWGEEIFFRGFLHLALQQKVSDKNSGLIEAAIFGIVHVFHHGLVMQQGQIRFYPLSGLIWIVLMFGVAMAFLWLKRKSGSIYPAIVAHAIFNLTMNWIIFYQMPD